MGYEGDGTNCSGKVQSNKSIIATDPAGFVLHPLRAHQSPDFLAHVELVVDTILLYLECSPEDPLVVFICFQILTSVHLKTSAT